MKRALRVGSALVTCLAAASAGHAQQTGALKGYVKDEQGLALPGAVVTLTGENVMGTRSASADSRGFYRLTNVPPGLYRVDAALQGFGQFAKENVRVAVGLTTPLDIALSVASREEVVTVSVAAPVVDIENTEQQFNVDKQAISTLPIEPRLTFQSVWQVVPGVTGGGITPLVNAGLEDYEGGQTGARNQHGAHETNIFIDGMNVNDPMNGLNYTTLAYDAIEEINVKTAGFAAEFGSARNGQMQVVTKSGGNELHGTALYQFQPESWNSTNVEGGSSQQLSYHYPALTLGGPIQKDKLWFFASWRYEWENLVRPDTQAADRIVRERRGSVWYGKLTSQLNDANRISVSGGYDKVPLHNEGNARWATEESLITRDRGGLLLSGLWTATLSSSAVFQFQTGYFNKPQRDTGQGSGSRIQYFDSFRGSLVGIEGNSDRNYDSSRESVYFHPNVTIYPAAELLGRHELKFGFEARPYQYITRAFIYNVDGQGIYDLSYGMDYASYGLSEPYLYEAREVFPPGPVNSVKVSGYAAYLQDSWHPSPNLTVNLGLRWEKQTHTTEGRGELPQSLEVFDPDVRSDVELDDSGLAPRLGFAYSFGDHGVLRASAGRFYERVGTGDYNNYPRGQGFNTYRVPSDSFGSGTETLEIFSSGTIPVNPAFNRNMRLEYNDELSIGYERPLPGDLAVGATFLYRKVNMSESSDANAIFLDDGTFARIDPDFDRVNRREFFTGDDVIRDVRFKSLQLSLRRNFTSNAGLLASFSRFWTRLDSRRFDPTETFQFAYESPDDLDMIDYRPRWNVKLSAYYRFPLDISLSTFLDATAGEWVNDVDGDFAWNDDAPRVTLPNGRQVADIIWQARNSYWAGGAWGSSGRFADTVYNWNLRLQKDVRLAGDRRLELSVDLYNPFNWAAYGGFESADVRNPRYDNRINPQRPRAVQANIRFVF